MESQGKPKEIRTLVIEDNATNLELMTYILSAFGHTTIKALNGVAGLTAAQADFPSLIICDVQLPELDGYEVARRLKADPQLRHIPLIAVTALAMVGDRERVLAAGFDGYIPKPIDPETFVRQIEAFLPAQERLGSKGTRHAGVSEPSTESRYPPRGTVLIVNHSSSNVELCRRMLEPTGFTVIAEESLAAAAYLDPYYTVPDLVVYDVHGYEDRGARVLEELDSSLRFRSTPLILVSSSAWRERERKAEGGLGPVKYLVRPLDPAVLLGAIDDCLGRYSAGGANY